MSKDQIEYRTGYDSKWIQQAFDLYNLAGLKRDNIIRVGKALENSAHVISAWRDSALVGIGRVLSDEVMYASIFDVAVLPNYQKRGIGRGIMTRLLATVPEACVHLTSTFGNEEFYQSLGFRYHKTAMALYPERLRQSPYLADPQP